MRQMRKEVDIVTMVMMGQEIPQNVMVMLKEGNGVMKAKVIVKDPVVEDGVPMGNQIQLLCHSPHQLPIHCHPALQWRQLPGTGTALVDPVDVHTFLSDLIQHIQPIAIVMQCSPHLPTTHTMPSSMVQPQSLKYSSVITRQDGSAPDVASVTRSPVQVTPEETRE